MNGSTSIESKINVVSQTDGSSVQNFKKRFKKKKKKKVEQLEDSDNGHNFLSNYYNCRKLLSDSLTCRVLNDS